MGMGMVSLPGTRRNMTIIIGEGGGQLTRLLFTACNNVNINVNVVSLEPRGGGIIFVRLRDALSAKDLI